MFKILNFKWLQVVFFAGAATGAVAGALAGLGMGFGAGLLLAQKPGKQLRDEISDKTVELAHDLKSRAGQVKDRVDSFVASRDNGEGITSNN
jgi:gas vesicle protein